MFDIIGTSCLKDIRELGFPEAIIAGGMARDHILGGDWTDIDVYVSSSRKKWHYVIDKFLTEGAVKFKYIDEPSIRLPEDYKFTQKLVGVLNLEYLGGIKVQVMAYDLPLDEFGSNVIKEFNYGIDQVYYDGKEVIGSEEFEKDQINETATLLKLDSVNSLPKAMKKFLKLQDKYPDVKFQCPLIEVKTEEKTPKLIGTGTQYTNNGGLVWYDEAPPTATVNQPFDRIVDFWENLNNQAGVR